MIGGLLKNSHQQRGINSPFFLSSIIKKRQNPIDFYPFLLVHGEGVE